MNRLLDNNIENQGCRKHQRPKRREREGTGERKGKKGVKEKRKKRRKLIGRDEDR